VVLSFKGVPSAGDRKKIIDVNNGHAIMEIIDRLYEEGLTSEIKVIGYHEATSYIVTQYEAYIISHDRDTVCLSASTLRYLGMTNLELKRGSE
jgi:CTP:phosphocholine cytidylyltransferase-like protein